MALERFKIMVIMEKLKAALDDKGSDHAINRFAHGLPLFAQAAVVGGALQRNLHADHLKNRKAQQRLLRPVKFLIMAKALQHLPEDNITDCQLLLTQCSVQRFGLGRHFAIEIVDPDRRVNDPHGQPSHHLLLL